MKLAFYITTAIVLALYSLGLSSCSNLPHREYNFSYDPATGEWSGGVEITPAK